MQIQINTDNNLKVQESVATQCRIDIANALDRFSDRITRIEVHLSDENANKKGLNDKRCMMEARIEGRQPIAVTDQAASLKQAIDGATDKLSRLVEHTLGRAAAALKEQAREAPFLQAEDNILSETSKTL